jgi:hypothetical protein
MEEQVRTRTSLLGSIKEAVIAIFAGKDEIVVSNIDEIADWDECKKNINKLSEDERNEIQEILKVESMLNRRKAQVKKSKESLKSQIKNPEKRPRMKAKIAEKDEKEK